MLARLEREITGEKGQANLRRQSVAQVRLDILQEQDGDKSRNFLNSADGAVTGLIIDCANCPGRKQQLKQLPRTIVSVEAQIAASPTFRESADLRSTRNELLGLLRLCTECGQNQTQTIPFA